jgi:hypothetical protein
MISASETISLFGVEVPALVVVTVGAVIVAYFAASQIFGMLRRLAARLAMRWALFAVLGAAGLSLEALVPGVLDTLIEGAQTSLDGILGGFF